MRDLRLATESRQALGIIRHRRQQHFDGDVAIQLDVACAIDLAHAAFAERCDDLVGAETGADSEAHFAPLRSANSAGQFWIRVNRAPADFFCEAVRRRRKNVAPSGVTSKPPASASASMSNSAAG